jgi:hypothetical protein
LKKIGRDWSCPVRVDISKRVGRVKSFVVRVVSWSLPSASFAYVLGLRDHDDGAVRQTSLRAPVGLMMVVLLLE